MITFKIKILLAFALKNKEKSKEKHKGKKKPDKKAAKKKIEPEVIDPPYVIRLDKSFSTAHIEYEILPGKCKLYQIDVLCWHNGAKIYTSDSVKLIKPIVQKGLTFVPICIEHFLKELTVEELIALHNHVIEFNVFTDKNKLGATAKLNKTEVMYINETDVDQTGFVEAYADNPNVSNTKSTQIKTDDGNVGVISGSTFFQRNEAYSRMKFDDNFAERFYNIIDYETDESIPREEIWYRDFAKACDPPNETKPQESQKKDPKKPHPAEKKSKTGGKAPKAEKATGKLTLRMQGEIFFTDTNEIFKVENYKADVAKLFVIADVEHLLTRLQKIQLNPIIIKLKAIQNFPEELLEGTGFTHVYCKYTIPSIANCSTIEKPISRDIKFMESHFFYTHTLSKIKLLEFLASRRLVVELYGIQRYQDVLVNPKMFGEKQGDSHLSRIQPEFRKKCVEKEESSKTKEILLAYSAYDLSSLLGNVWDFRAKAQLHCAGTQLKTELLPQLKDIPMSNDHSCEFWSHYKLSINKVNLAGINLVRSSNSPLKEWILIENDTVLDLEAYLLSPQSAALVLHQISGTYMRLFLIAFRRDIALPFFTKILKHNQRVIGENIKADDLLTGFVIDNGNNFAIYVEGPSVGYILNVWQELDATPLDAKIFFNTDQAYEERLYGVCNKWSGYYVINMKIPLQDIFKNPKIYVKGNVPLLCQKALIKLNLLFLSKSLKEMFQYNLFPTIDELVSLDIEYGVPYAWKHAKASVTSTGTEERNI